MRSKKLMRVIAYPVFVSFVKTCDIIDTDALLIFTTSFLNLADEVRNRTLQINKKIRRIDKRHHEIEKVRIILEIPCAHESHAVEVRSKDACILIDCAVLVLFFLLFLF